MKGVLQELTTSMRCPEDLGPKYQCNSGVDCCLLRTGLDRAKSHLLKSYTVVRRRGPTTTVMTTLTRGSPSVILAFPPAQAVWPQADSRQGGGCEALTLATP